MSNSRGLRIEQLVVLAEDVGGGHHEASFPEPAHHTRHRWLPGLPPGDLAASELDPLVFNRWSAAIITNT